jgi:cobalamin biosynthesis protein CbiG
MLLATVLLEPIHLCAQTTAAGVIRGRVSEASGSVVELAFLQKYVQPKHGLSSTSTDALLLNGPTRVTGDGQTRRTSASDER